MCDGSLKSYCSMVSLVTAICRVECAGALFRSCVDTCTWAEVDPFDRLQEELDKFDPTEDDAHL